MTYLSAHLIPNNELGASMKRTKLFNARQSSVYDWRTFGLLLVILCASWPLPLGAQTPAGNSPDGVTVLAEQATPAGTNTIIRINVRKDAFIASRQPDTNFGGNQELRLGWNTGTYEAMRILIEFDIAAIPRNAIVHNAQLHIFQLGVTPGGDRPMGYRAQYMRSAWDEGGVTWNNANYLGGENLQLRDVDAGIGWKQADVTNLVKSWYSGAQTNHGLIVIGDETASANRMREFTARESSNSPYITIDYTVVCDTSAPAARVQPLPTFSPGLFTVSWSGTDSAPTGCQASGVATYDVEYRINGGGWHRWKSQTTALSNSFKDWAANGDFVEFRSRAVDHAGNVQALNDAQASTRIDTEPPQVIVTPLPAVTVAQTIVIAWRGVDNLSGIAHYDVQWRENGGSWEMLLEETAQTAYQITGVRNGVTYDFRVRATDQVGNGDEWPNTPQASTTVSTNAVATILPFNPPILKPTAPITTSFVLNWTGVASIGVPITAYDIYYQYNGGAWQLWQTLPANQISIAFPYQQLGLGDGAFGFEAIAINSTGQREPQSFKAEAVMLIDLADAIQPRLYLPFIAEQRNAVAADDQAASAE